MKESIVRARRENVLAFARHIVSIARLALALILSVVVFNLTNGHGVGQAICVRDSNRIDSRSMAGAVVRRAGVHWVFWRGSNIRHPR